MNISYLEVEAPEKEDGLFVYYERVQPNCFEGNG